MQHIAQYSALQTGLAWLRSGLGIVFGAGTTANVVAHVQPRLLASLGMAVAAVAVLALSLIQPHTSYNWHIVPAIFTLAFGFPMGFVPITLTAVKGVAAEETGIASALLNALQQIGVALGLAVLSSASVKATAAAVPDALEALYAARRSGTADLARSEWRPLSAATRQVLCWVRSPSSLPQ